MKRYFCTYFDSNYLVRGLAMIRSLAQWVPELTVYVLALDDQCFDTLAGRHGLEPVVPLRQSELEEFDPDLHAARPSRSRAEYIFTMTPCLPRYILSRHPEIDLLTYLDADLYFFSSPEPIFVQLGLRNVAIVSHRFAPNVRHLAALRGKYNVSWLTFANSPEGWKCLEWYRARCLEWCFDRVEAGRYADQKYLEGFAEVAEGVVEIDHPGANAAPWNLGNGGVEVTKGKLFVDRQPLIFFHYQGLKRCLGNVYDCGLFAYRLRLPTALRQAIFCSYIKAVLALKRELDLPFADFTYGFRYRTGIPVLMGTGRFLFEIYKIIFGYCVTCTTLHETPPRAGMS